MCVYDFICFYMSIYVCIFMFVYLCLYIYVCIFMFVCVRMYVYKFLENNVNIIYKKVSMFILLICPCLNVINIVYFNIMGNFNVLLDTMAFV